MTQTDTDAEMKLCDRVLQYPVLDLLSEKAHKLARAYKAKLQSEAAPRLAPVPTAAEVAAIITRLACNYGNLTPADAFRDIATLLRILRERPSLFRSGEFTSHSGQALSWKIECDALTDADWEALAKMAVPLLKPFRRVVGIERGGLKFAQALERHVTKGAHMELIADDVLTTGGSMEKARSGLPSIQGVVAFARGPCPSWITPICTLTQQADSCPPRESGTGVGYTSLPPAEATPALVKREALVDTVAALSSDGRAQAGIIVDAILALVGGK